MSDQERPIETPFPQKVADFKRRRLPVIVWSIAALACVWMLADRAGRFEYIGVARALQYEVSAAAAGQIETVFVDVYDRVEAGDRVAMLDNAELDARIERAQASVRQLTAELHAAKSKYLATNNLDRAGWENNLRRFQTDEEERRLAVLELRVTIESDEIELERLTLNLERSKPLLRAGLIGQGEYDQMRLLRDTVAQRTEDNEILLAQTEKELRAAQQRREGFEANLPTLPDAENLLAPLRAGVEAENLRLREIQIRRTAMMLTSPVAGQVSSILCRSGQTVTPGDPILTITESAVTEYLAFLDESDSRSVRTNSPVFVSSLSQPGVVAESVVLRVGPDYELMPERLWAVPSTPQYGRAVVIAAAPSLLMTPGELLNVRFE